MKRIKHFFKEGLALIKLKFFYRTMIVETVGVTTVMLLLLGASMIDNNIIHALCLPTVIISLVAIALIGNHWIWKD